MTSNAYDRCPIPSYIGDMFTKQMILARDDEMIWCESLGVGYHPLVDNTRYDSSYFDKYLVMDESEMGRKLTEARVNFVSRNWRGPVLDFGIGGGAFLTAMRRTPHGRDSKGFDINPHAVDWLRRADAFPDVFEDFDAATFWDALEHVPDIGKVLQRIRHKVFISIPILPPGKTPGPDWRHYRPGEHLLYVNQVGIINVMRQHGFSLIDHSTIETDLGRLDIGSYAFARVRR